MLRFIKPIFGTNLSLLKHDRDGQTDMARDDWGRDERGGQGRALRFYKACRKWKFKIGFGTGGIKEHTAPTSQNKYNTGKGHSW